jgi:hypothetical protein
MINEIENIEMCVLSILVLVEIKSLVIKASYLRHQSLGVR